MRTKEKLLLLMTYLHNAQRVGNTTLLVNGLRYSDNGIVVVRNIGDVKNIQSHCEKKVNYISWDNIDRLRGTRSPIIIDNSALMHILYDALELITELEFKQELNKNE